MIEMKKTKISSIGLFLAVVLATSAFAGVVVESGSTQYVSNQVIIGCDNNVAQKLKSDLFLDSDDCIVPGENSARLKLIRMADFNSYQVLIVGDAVGLEAAVEVLRFPNTYISGPPSNEIIVARNIETNIITVTNAVSGFAISSVPSLTSLGGGNYQYSVELSAGWNFVSFPIVLNEDNPNVVFDAIRADVIRVYSYDPSKTAVKWIKWNPESGAPSEITNIKPQIGYILYMNNPADLTVQGRAGIGTPETPPSLPIASGWNLITLHGFLPRKLSSALGSVADKYDSVWTVVNNELVRLEISDDPYLAPGQTYWIHMTASGELVP